MVRSQDYHAHISKVRRTPSILTDVPQYPNAHLAFNNKKVVYEEDKGFHLRHHNSQPCKSVEVVEYEQTTIPENGVEVVFEENEDVETNQYCPMKNKGGFEVQKWKPQGLNKLMTMNLVSYGGNSIL